MPGTAYGKFHDFCRDTGSRYATLPVCNLFNESPARGGTGYGGCDLLGINLSGGEQLANLGSILVAFLAILASGALLWRTERKKAAVGRREMQIFLIGFIIIMICEIFTVGGFPLNGGVRRVFSAVHIAAIVASTWILMMNGAVGYQLLDDGTPLSVALVFGSAAVLFIGTGYIALDTGFSWTGYWDDTLPSPNQAYALYTLYQLMPLVFLVVYFILETVLVLRVLGEIRPMYYLIAATIIFALGQIFQYLVSVHICNGTNGKINGGFFETLFTLIAVTSCVDFTVSKQTSRCFPQGTADLLPYPHNDLQLRSNGSQQTGFFQEDSDEDSIKTNTIAESEWDSDREYEVEKILAEEPGDDGQPRYLLKWEGYPLHRCTWESRENLSSALLLQEWSRDKVAFRNGTKQSFDINDYTTAVEQFSEDAESKRLRRIAKRRKRGEIVRSLNDEESSDDEALSRSARRMKARAPPITRKGVARISPKRSRKPTVVNMGVSSEDESEDSDPLASFKRPRLSPKDSTAPSEASDTTKSELSKPSNGAAPPAERIVPSKPVAQPIATKKVETQAPSAPATESTKSLLPKPQAPTPTNAARKSASTVAAKSAPQNAQPTSNVFSGDWAKEMNRRQRVRVSGETPKDSTDPKFTRLSIQSRYQKYGNNEPAPNPDALVMVDPKTGVRQPPKAAPPKKGPSEIHSAYGRMTPPPESTREPSCPARPTAQPLPPTRRVTDVPTLNTNVQAAKSPVDAPASAIGARKNIVCKFWQSGNCQYTADHCQFAHSFGPDVAPSKKETTCFYWINSGACRYSAETCEFAHFDTGVYAGPPGTYRRNSMAAARPHAKASDLSLITGSSSPADTFFDASEQLPQAPLSAPPRENEFTSLRNNQINDGDAMIIDSTELIQSPTNSTSPPKPKLAEPTAIDPTQISPAKDPRLRRPPTGATEPQLQQPVAMDIATPVQKSLGTDLAMAEHGVPNLDSIRLLKGEQDQIKHVYIHMPKERSQELELLFEFFKDFNCDVYCPRPKSANQWDHFRKLFDRNSKKTVLLILHPSELFKGSIPGLYTYLADKGAKLRVFSIGVQHEQCVREEREPVYGAQRLFPLGGLIFITDDVFVYYPEKAIEIIEKFLKDAELRPPGTQNYKIGARPGIKNWMMRLADKSFDEQAGKGKGKDLRYTKCYDALCLLCPIEDEDPAFPGQSVPLENSNLWSAPEDFLSPFKGMWERNPEEATDYMATYFASEAHAKAWKYRKFMFVYQQKLGTSRSPNEEEMKPPVDPKGWMAKYNHIGVVTPEQALKTIRGK